MVGWLSKSDVPLLTWLIPVAREIPAEWLTNSPAYLQFVASIPDWLWHASYGFALAFLLQNLWRRIRRRREAPSAIAEPICLLGGIGFIRDGAVLAVHATFATAVLDLTAELYEGELFCGITPLGHVREGEVRWIIIAERGADGHYYYGSDEVPGGVRRPMSEAGRVHGRLRIGSQTVRFQVLRLQSAEELEARAVAIIMD